MWHASSVERDLRISQEKLLHFIDLNKILDSNCFQTLNENYLPL